MKIQVTKEDIEKGVRHKGQRCPVALAVKRKGFSGVEVGYCTLRTSKTLGFYMLPKKVQEFIKAFDSHQPVKPFSFILKGVKL